MLPIVSPFRQQGLPPKYPGSLVDNPRPALLTPHLREPDYRDNGGADEV